MDKPKYQNCNVFLIKLITVLFASYAICAENTTTKTGFSTWFASKDPFYKVSLYKENYILPYHRLDKVIKPRPATIARVKPIFEQRAEILHKQQHGNSNELAIPLAQDSSHSKHRRTPSREDPKRHGVIIDPSSLEIPESPVQHRQGPGNTLQRTLTTLQKRTFALEKLEGDLGNATDPQNKAAIENQINLTFQQLMQELVPRPQYEFMKPVEVAFQISFKIPLLRLKHTDTRFYAAYTQQGWWQTKTRMSAFFREINFMPEFFIEKPFLIQSTWRPQIENIKIGVIHQSNGVGLYFERSWNRIFIEAKAKLGPFQLMFEPWYILNTKDKNIYNQDIHKHLGYWKASLNFKHKVFQCTLQKQVSSYQILATISLLPSLNLMFYRFSGKGSTLGLYEKENSSWGIGIEARQ